MPMSLHVDDDGVSLVHYDLWRRERREVWSVRYSEIEGVSMSEPQRLRRGRLELRPTNGNAQRSYTFGRWALSDMRGKNREIWKQVKAARDRPSG
jgi:hypothetical protein